MAKAMKCDRCGRSLAFSRSARFFEFYTVVVDNENPLSGFNTLTQGCYSHEDGYRYKKYHYKKSYDLCQECCKEFNEWLDKPVRID